MRGLVILYSGANGWDQRAQPAAIALGRAGALVAGIDLREYERHNRDRSRKCFYLVGDAEAIAHELERTRNDTEYHAPIVAGIDVGGALAELVLREAPPSTLAGAVSIDPVAPKHPLCAAGHIAANTLPGFWTVGLRNSPNRFVQRAEARTSSIDCEILAPTQIRLRRWSNW